MGCQQRNMSYISKHISRRLKELRGLRSQREIANAAEIGTSQYSRYERGAAVPSDEVLERISKALGCYVEDIIGAGEPISGIPKISTKDSYHYLANAIGSRLGVLRREVALDMEEVAQRAGIPLALYKKFELCQDIPDDDTLAALANALNINIVNLVGDAGSFDFIRGEQTFIDFSQKHFSDFSREEIKEAARNYHLVQAMTANDIHARLDSALKMNKELIEDVRALTNENLRLRHQLADLRSKLEISTIFKKSLENEQ